MTLSQLRILLSLAHGPAVERLPERGVGAVARAYLARRIEICGPSWSSTWTILGLLQVMADGEDTSLWRLDLTDPGTANAVKVALALARGHDPGPLGVSCSWDPVHDGMMSKRRRVSWCVSTSDDATYFVQTEHAMGAKDEIVSDEIAGEKDAIKALVLACQHVIKLADASKDPL